jgi:CubicO group peptidase (beta-lactamase class C family)
MRHHRVSLFALLLFLTTAVVIRADDTDDFIRAEMKSQNIPGLALAVVKNGEIIKTAGYGLANVNRKLPVTPETVFHIGSIGKQFVAAGIMLLVQEGRLGLDDPISKYLEGIPPTWNAITIRHLLTHTSGIVREEPGFDPSKVQNFAEVMKAAYPLPLRFAPGEKWAYSNAGYSQLGEIIRKVSGRPWSDYLSEKVFRPSGMNSTYLTDTKESIPNRARGYIDNDNPRESDDWRALHPAGGFLSTVLDLAKWDAVFDTDKIISASTRREMWTPVRLNDGTSHPYGLGWELGPLDGHARVWHGGQVSGGSGGFRSDFSRFSDFRLTVILLMNLDDVDHTTLVSGVFYRLRGTKG